MASINGIAHIQLSVSDMSRSVPFYEKLLHSLEMITLVKSKEFFYCIGGRTGVAISPIAPEFRDQPYDQRRAGLHHVCFRARSREDVDCAAAKVREIGGRIDRGPIEGNWAPGYYYFVFEDPDGIRLEINHVPGRGLLATDPPINPSSDPDWNQNSSPPKF